MPTMGERKFSEWHGRGITCSSFDRGKTFSAVVANAKVHSPFHIFCANGEWRYGSGPTKADYSRTLELSGDVKTSEVKPCEKNDHDILAIMLSECFALHTSSVPRHTYLSISS